jgi:hypothetical protein
VILKSLIAAALGGTAGYGYHLLMKCAGST